MIESFFYHLGWVPAEQHRAVKRQLALTQAVVAFYEAVHGNEDEGPDRNDFTMFIPLDNGKTVQVDG